MKFSPAHHLLKSSAVIASLLFFFTQINAQVPQGIPNEDYPTDWSSWSSWIMYVILPVVLIFVVGFRKRLLPKKGGKDDLSA